jgi:hypothetical protein
MSAGKVPTSSQAGSGRAVLSYRGRQRDSSPLQSIVECLRKRDLGNFALIAGKISAGVFLWRSSDCRIGSTSARTANAFGCSVILGMFCWPEMSQDDFKSAWLASSWVGGS